MTDQKIEGTINDTKGKVKEGVGELTGDERLQGEGRADQLQGKLQKGLGEVQETLQDTADDLRDGLDDAGDRTRDEVGKHR